MWRWIPRRKPTITLSFYGPSRIVTKINFSPPLNNRQLTARVDHKGHYVPHVSDSPHMKVAVTSLTEMGRGRVGHLDVGRSWVRAYHDEGVVLRTLQNRLLNDLRAAGFNPVIADDKPTQLKRWWPRLWPFRTQR